MQKERQGDILTVLGKRDGASVGELSKLLGVSEVTIRSDLSELAQAGLLRRTRGGARSITVSERPLEQTSRQHAAVKRRIGTAAAGRVQDGQTIFLDVGSTTTEIARQLSPALRGVTVVTNGLNIALELERHAGLHIIVTGGSLRRLQHSLVAPYALELLGRIRADLLFLGCNGIEATHGVTNVNFDEAEVKSRMVEYAKQVIVVADPSKIGQVSRAHIVPVSRVQLLISGRQDPSPALSALRGELPELLLV